MHISLGDVVGIGTIVSLCGGQITALIMLSRNGRKTQTVHRTVQQIQRDISLPSNGKSIGHLTEDIAQAFHLMAQIFQDEARAKKE